MSYNKILIAIISLFSLQSCAQKDVNMDRIANLYQEVQYRDQKINYHAKYYIGGCNFELLINGVPEERYYGPGDGAMSASAPINGKILQSGEQTWEIRVYPVHIDGIPQTEISKDARIELKIQAIKYKENGDIEKRYEPVLDFEAPLIKDEETGRNILADGGKPYISYKGTFKAEVPYTLEGWTHGEEFDPADSTALKKEVLAKFNQLRELIVKKKATEFEDLVLHKEKEVTQAFFVNKEQAEDRAQTYKEMFDGSLQDLEMVTFDDSDTQLHYYGENRLVTLLFTPKKCPRCKGESVLVGTFKEGERERMRSFQIYLYRPKGSKELQIIR